MKRMLLLASVASMIDQFNMSNIELLIQMGYKVDVACNFKSGSTCSRQKIQDLKKELSKMGVKYYQIDFTRNVFDLRQDYKAYRQVKKLAEENQYSFLHCHSPIGGVIGRLIGHRMGVKVIYTAHGFHFFKGAPAKNWLIYYPVEKLLSRWTDILITINKEDYHRAKRRFCAKKVFYIPGVGVDTKKFAVCQVDREKKREELGISKDGFVLLSVGEFQERKNQRVVIEALHCLKNPKIYYLMVGQGIMEKEYKTLIDKYSLQNQIKILGFRTDVDELCKIADCFVHPSIREGLGIAPLEGMASGLPLISSNINGIKAFTKDGESGCCIEPNSVEEVRAAIERLFGDKTLCERCGKNNIQTAKRFDIEKSREVMSEIDTYGGGYCHVEDLLIRQKKRRELGIRLEDFMIISVGELNENKNHRVIIEAISRLKNPQIKYIICGQGKLHKELQELIKKKKLEKQVRLLGFREDIKELLHASDVFAFPSKREGLGLAAIEAMASGLPLITSNIHGIMDYSRNGVTGYCFRSDNIDGFVKGIYYLQQNPFLCMEMGTVCLRASMTYSRCKVNREMKKIYTSI